MVTYKEMPDDFVYTFTKEIFKNKPLLVSVHKSAQEVEPKNILYSPIPLHPGAIKYYEEIGIKIPKSSDPKVSGCQKNKKRGHGRKERRPQPSRMQELIRTREFGKTWSWVIYGVGAICSLFHLYCLLFKTYRSMVFQGNAHLIPWIPFVFFSILGGKEREKRSIPLITF